MLTNAYARVQIWETIIRNFLCLFDIVSGLFSPEYGK